MADLACEILFLIDRIASREDFQGLAELTARLEGRGHPSRVLCQSIAVDHAPLNLSEHPGLSRRWQRPWTIRGLELEPSCDRPRVMHVLSASMADVALAIAERWRVPYLLGVDEFPGRYARLRLSRDWCRGLVAANGELGSALVRDFGIPPRVIHQIPRSVRDFEQLRQSPRLPRVPVVGAAGPLVAGSGFGTFLNAARKVVDAGMDAEFLIAGDGEDESELRRRAERLRIADRLTFADDIPVGLSFWDVLDVYCQTSLVPSVGRPLTLAMAAGVASIASDVEGTRSLILDGENGLTVPQGDSTALANAITRLLQEPEFAQQLGEAGRRAVLVGHNPDKEADQLHSLYREIVAAGLGPRDSGLASRAVAFEAASGLDSGRVIAGLEVSDVPS